MSQFEARPAQSERSPLAPLAGLGAPTGMGEYRRPFALAREHSPSKKPPEPVSGQIAELHAWEVNPAGNE
jgi:hypothetical protein